jgi:hypothetical protein
VCLGSEVEGQETYFIIFHSCCAGMCVQNTAVDWGTKNLAAASQLAILQVVGHSSCSSAYLGRETTRNGLQTPTPPNVANVGEKNLRDTGIGHCTSKINNGPCDT